MFSIIGYMSGVPHEGISTKDFFRSTTDIKGVERVNGRVLRALEDGSITYRVAFTPYTTVFSHNNAVNIAKKVINSFSDHFSSSIGFFQVTNLNDGTFHLVATEDIDSDNIVVSELIDINNPPAQ